MNQLGEQGRRHTVPLGMAVNAAGVSLYEKGEDSISNCTSSQLACIPGGHIGYKATSPSRSSGRCEPCWNYSGDSASVDLSQVSGPFPAIVGTLGGTLRGTHGRFHRLTLLPTRLISNSIPGLCSWDPAVRFPHSVPGGSWYRSNGQ